MGGRPIARRHGLILGGKKVPIDKPRARDRDDRGEVLLETYERLQRSDALPRSALAKMVRGVLDEQGHKQLLGLRQGGSENAAVCTSLLTELRERGLDTKRPILAVLARRRTL